LPVPNMKRFGKLQPPNIFWNANLLLYLKFSKKKTLIYYRTNVSRTPFLFSLKLP